ncbi:hypothetical protein SSS_00103 [Sarcoptes scabiei]|uniref:Uncharacterized protein n=1 Tax=Sarcoptes scabiei TaxID=52283 RepID=A0A834RG53_SARSC|nr:hypothetical protein SSS_00103 [Sarcoptes scabiei]
MMFGHLTAEYMSTDDQDDLDYYGLMLANLINTRHLLGPDKRSCLRRGSSCDHRPNDCCLNSVCRCNLWGTNCRCSRMGLFQVVLINNNVDDDDDDDDDHRL